VFRSWLATPPGRRTVLLFTIGLALGCLRSALRPSRTFGVTKVTGSGARVSAYSVRPTQSDEDNAPAPSGDSQHGWRPLPPSAASVVGESGDGLARSADVLWLAPSPTPYDPWSQPALDAVQSSQAVAAWQPLAATAAKIGALRSNIGSPPWSSDRFQFVALAAPAKAAVALTIVGSDFAVPASPTASLDWWRARMLSTPGSEGFPALQRFAIRRHELVREILFRSLEAATSEGADPGLLAISLADGHLRIMPSAGASGLQSTRDNLSRAWQNALQDVRGSLK
jgi:hypothetical protein